MADSLCGSIVQSRRGLLAFGWSVVTLLTFVAFITASIFTLSSKALADDYYDDNYNNNNNGEDAEGGGDADNNNNSYGSGTDIAVTSRAMAFAALWTAVLAGIMAVFGTVVLGWQSPTGRYYWCCAGNVHRTTPLSLGAFVGGLLMFANLTLVCAVLFGEFKIRDKEDGQTEDDGENAQELAVERSSMAFSIMCVFLTILYAGFAALVFAFSDTVLEENRADARTEALSPSDPDPAPGFIGGERFDVLSAHNTPSGHHNSGGFLQPTDQSHSGSLT